MTGKFWDMYKGSASFDSFDETDTEMLVSLTVGATKNSVMV